VSLVLSSCSTTEEACAEYDYTSAEAEHACAHVEDGPFGDLGDGDELSNLHLLYTVELREVDGQYQGELSFVARESAVHAFVFREADLPFAIRSGGEDLCVVEDTTEGCDDYSAAYLAELERNQEVTLVIGPTSQPTVRVVAERQ
jgi:hypothetical protein